MTRPNRPFNRVPSAPVNSNVRAHSEILIQFVELDFGHFPCDAAQNPSWFNGVTPELEHVA